MKNRLIIFTAVFLMISIGNYFRIVADGSVSMVEFSSIFAIGALSGLLIAQIIKTVRDKNKN